MIDKKFYYYFFKETELRLKISFRVEDTFVKYSKTYLNIFCTADNFLGIIYMMDIYF